MLARLGAELYYADPESRARGMALSREALASARRVGEPAVLSFALACAHFTFWSPDDLDDRLAIATEAVRLGQRTDDKELEFRGRAWRVLDLLELADIPSVDVEIELCGRLAEALRQPVYHWYVGVFRAMRSLMEGRFEECERLALEALTLGQRTQLPFGDQASALQLFYLRGAQGRIEELEPAVRSFAELNRLKGAASHEAARAAAAERLRPVLMTSLAMIAGMIPMAIAFGQGSEETAPLGRAVIGGLLVATLATLFLLPMVLGFAQRHASTGSRSLDPEDPESKWFEQSSEAAR